MFNQVYFHKTRVILDFHLQKAMEAMLPNSKLPPPSDLDAYLQWDDWRVLGRLADGQGGEHGQRLLDRDFYRQVWSTPENPNDADLEKLNKIRSSLQTVAFVERDASKSWYKLSETDVFVSFHKGTQTVPLSQCSSVIANLLPIQQSRIYVAKEERTNAMQKISSVGGK